MENYNDEGMNELNLQDGLGLGDGDNVIQDNTKDRQDRQTSPEVCDVTILILDINAKTY
jgi:hypothetical protein